MTDDDAARGTMTAGWYPAESGRLRYYDGVVWTGAVKADPEAERAATYGEKFRRRLPIALAVVVGLNALVWLLLILNPPENALPGSAPAVIRAIAIVISIVSILVGALFWTALASLFRGRVLDPAPRRTWLLVGGAVGAVAVGIVAGLQGTPTTVVDSVVIASPAEGCQAFLDTFETVAAQNLPAAAARPYFIELADAARTYDSELAADVDAIVAASDETAVQTAAQSILTRCVTNGLIAEDTLTAWLDKLETYQP